MTIKLTDAAKYFKGEDQQVKAWEYLNGVVSADVLAEFEKIWREKPPTPPAGEVPEPGIKLIKEFEGCRLSAYPDPLTGGEPITCGWGNTRKKDGSKFKLGDKITQAEADELLLLEAKEHFIPVLKKIPHWNEMNANQRGAILSFAYNLGAHFYGDTNNFGSITRALSSKEHWKDVPEALYKYRNPGSNVEAGLARRRKAEGKLWVS